MTTVTVHERIASDSMWGDESTFADGYDVPGCLVAPASSEITTRPNAIEHDYTVHFPRGFGRSIDGALIEFGDGLGERVRCRVVGSPRPMDESICVGPWSMQVDVRRVTG